MLTPTGLGAWDGKSQLTEESASTLFPSLRFTRESELIMGDELQLLVAYAGDVKLFSTFDGVKVTIHSPMIDVDGGLRVGADASLADRPVPVRDLEKLLAGKTAHELVWQASRQAH